MRPFVTIKCSPNKNQLWSSLDKRGMKSDYLLMIEFLKGESSSAQSLPLFCLCLPYLNWS